MVIVVDDKPALVVVVDDDASMRQAVERLLTAGGFRVLVFQSTEALQASQCVGKADCLVLDMRLPGQYGHHFYAALARPKPPAMFITADDSPAMRRMAFGAGANGYLAKPFEGAALLDWVTAVTRGRVSGSLSRDPQ